ncbi:Macrophage mannose receptor 1 [Bagarius yarrelli]|uniref:Macrophage mannose receptor 1 n=1 Tax=Bagarius yarrelli TaxID=175774 RepID=A0A556TYT6_BAGYA|nr:Macrophage mannose receptor 1 [Bagarius yarrelli]
MTKLYFPLFVLLCLCMALNYTVQLDSSAFLIYNEAHNKCVKVVDPNLAQVSDCDLSSNTQRFRWISSSRILSISHKQCLAAQDLKELARVVLLPCNELSPMQTWECKNETLFGIKGQPLHLNYRNEQNVVLYSGTGSWSLWEVYGKKQDLCSHGYQELFTIGGNALGSPCQFPFKYEEKWFAECTLEGRSDGMLWCATVTDYSKEKKWGFCPTKSSSGWDTDPVTGVLYQRNTQSVLTWHQARKSCQQQDADLLSIMELHEQTYISGHPLLEPGMNCAALNAGKASKWESKPCSNKLGYICRKGNSTAVTPSVGKDEPSFCPATWVPYSGHCYSLSRTKMMWSDALTACRKEGADLTSIHNIEEHSFIISQSGYLPTDELWIGLNDQKTQNLFEWSDRTHVTFAKWLVGEPSHTYFLREDCVLMKGKDGKWADHMCEKEFGYMCKKKASTKPAGSPEVISPGCPTGWIRFNSFCYNIAVEAKTFSEAKTACGQTAANLMQVSDRYENAFLISQIGLRPEKYFWIGLSNTERADRFEWTNKQTVKFTHFNVGMPGRQQGCVAMRTGTSAGLWDVINCDSKEKYICKKIAEGVTTTKEPPATQPLSCPSKWIKKDPGSCIQIYRNEKDNKKTWSEARDYCISIGGDLASFHSEAETNNLPYGGGSDTAWIGFNILNDNAGFVWSDETPSNYENWAYGEPNNYNSNELCAEASFYYGHRWNDRDCEAYNDWICQIQLAEFNITDDGWIQFNGSQYYINNDRLDMDSARAYCKRNHSDLIVITGQTERKFIYKQISRGTEDQYYIGMTVGLDKSFSWVDGSPVVYTAWNQNEPNFANNDENCVTIYKSMGFWNDINCGVQLPSICKRSVNFVTSTSAPTTAPKGGCSSDWTAFQGKCYKFVDKESSEDKSWYDARQYCIYQGGNLVSILSNAEQAFLTTKMLSARDDMWIGFNDVNWEMRFLWTDGKGVQYTNWAKGYPVSYPDGRRATYGTDANPQIQVPVTTVSPVSYFKLGNDSYKVQAEKMGWDEARRQCKADDADLASVLESVTQAYITLKIGKLKEPMWIGLNTNVTSGRYRWVDNWLLRYTKWAAGEPLKNQGCVYIDIDGTWKTSVCTKSYYSLCKRSPVIAPTDPPQLPGRCPEPKKSKVWIPFRGHCYTFIASRNENWPHASVECMRLGASLVSVEDDLESTFIRKNVEILHDEAKSFWIGLHRSYAGEWMWIDNVVIDYINWAPRSPGTTVIPPTEKHPAVEPQVHDATHGYTGIAVAVVLVIIAVAGLAAFLFYKRPTIPVVGECTFDNTLYFNHPTRSTTTVDTKGLVTNMEQNEHA